MLMKWPTIKLDSNHVSTYAVVVYPDKELVISPMTSKDLSTYNLSFTEFRKEECFICHKDLELGDKLVSMHGHCVRARVRKAV